MIDSERQAVLDEEHLWLLRFGYIVAGVTSALLSPFALVYVAMGVFTSQMMPTHANQAESARAVGIVMAVFGGLLFALFAGGGALKLFASRCLRLRRHKTVCQIAAAISCIGIPYGTILGIFTFQVLGRASVAALFGDYPRSPFFEISSLPPPPPPAAPNV